MYTPRGQVGLVLVLFFFTVVFFGFLLLCFGVLFWVCLFVCLFVAVLGFNCSMLDLVS